MVALIGWLDNLPPIRTKYSLAPFDMKIKLGQRKHSLKVITYKYIYGGACALASRSLFLPFAKRERNRIVIMSHTYSGNAKAFAEWLIEKHPEIETVFASDDPFLYRKLKAAQSKNGPKMLSLHNIFHLFFISRSSLICTTHGPSLLTPWLSSKRRPNFVEF